MSYEAENIAATLKAAREKKGLSQRALSARAGVPQSHISKIESGAVNLRLSSLAAIANALDLEIALIPRKAAPAVRSITRAVDETPSATPAARKELARIARQIEGLQGLKIDTSALAALQRQFRELTQFQNMLRDTEALRHIRESLNAVENAGGMKAMREAEAQMTKLRNMLAHSRMADEAPRPRAAYSLDEDDDA
jgi:transcriptional regulator with XRE-family HTH domain